MIDEVCHGYARAAVEQIKQVLPVAKGQQH